MPDHGFLLGEHNWWGKVVQPFYNEVARTPLFIWDPRCGISGERRNSLVQMIDLPATLFEYFGVSRPKDMLGVPLRGTITADTPVREAALFGVHGGHVCCTDGRYVYMRTPIYADNKPLYEYTVMPTHVRELFSVEELQTVELAEPFAFTKGCQTMRIEAQPWMDPYPFGTLLFDVENDPAQEHPLDDSEIEAMMIQHLVKLMQTNDAPLEQFERLGLLGYLS